MTASHCVRGLVLLCAVLLSGCVNLSRTLEPEPIFPKPSEAINVSGLDTNCATTPGNVENNTIPAEIRQFAVAMNCAYQTQGDPAKFPFWMVRFIDKGIALSDQTCGLFFGELEKRRVEASHAQTNMNIAGTAVTAVFAAAENHARSIFNMATLLTTGNALFENYKAHYVMTPQLRKLHNKIQQGLRDPVKAQIKSKSAGSPGYRTFDEAKQDLMDYERLCSHAVIVDVITDSVAKAEITTFGATTSPEAAKLIEEIYQAAAPKADGATKAAGRFGNAEFELLYVAASSPEKDRPAFAKAIGELYPQVKTYIANLKLDSTPSADILATFKYAAMLLGLEGRADIKDLKKKVSEYVAANPAPDPKAPKVALSPTLAAERKDALEKSRSDFSEALRSVQPLSAPGNVNFNWEIKDNSKR